MCYKTECIVNVNSLITVGVSVCTGNYLIELVDSPCTVLDHTVNVDSLFCTKVHVEDHEPCEVNRRCAVFVSCEVELVVKSKLSVHGLVPPVLIELDLGKLLEVEHCSVKSFAGSIHHVVKTNLVDTFACLNRVLPCCPLALADESLSKDTVVAAFNECVSIIDRLKNLVACVGLCSYLVCKPFGNASKSFKCIAIHICAGDMSVLVFFFRVNNLIVATVVCLSVICCFVLFTTADNENRQSCENKKQCDTSEH